MSAHPPKGDRPPSIQPCNVRVARIAPGDLYTFRMLSEEVLGVITHWIRGRSRYCRGSQCRADWHKQERIWKGYVAAEGWNCVQKLWRPTVLEITEHAELDMRGIYRRGQIWSVFREKESSDRKQPCRASLLRVDSPSACPQPFSIVSVLLHVYGEHDLEVNVPNPLPPRLVLMPSEGCEPPPPTKEMQPAMTLEERGRYAGMFQHRNGATHGSKPA